MQAKWRLSRLNKYGILNSLFLVLRVHADGYWPVIKKLHLHVSSKFARSHLLADCIAQFAAEFLVERYGYLVTSRAEPRRAVAFLYEA